MSKQEAFLFFYSWATNEGSFDRCANLLKLLCVGMTLSSAATILAVFQGQIGDQVTPSGYLIKMMKKEVLLASIPGLALNLVVVGAASNPAIENLLTKLWGVQIEIFKREEAQRVEKEQPKPIMTQ